MDGYHVLFLSIFALALGPVAHQAARWASSTVAVLDGFVLIAIAGLILLHVLPESILHGGWVVILSAAAGFLAPTVIERRLHRYAAQAHTAALLLASVGLVVHAFADGLALAETVGSAASREDSMLPAAVVLHRLPVGATLWVLLRPPYGQRLAMAALAILAVATVVGYELGEAAVADVRDSTWALFQALVAGSLMHVLVHRTPVSGPESRRVPTTVGGVGGLLLVLFITWNEGVPETTGWVAYPLPTVIFLFYVFCRLSRRFRSLFGHDHTHSTRHREGGDSH